MNAVFLFVAACMVVLSPVLVLVSDGKPIQGDFALVVSTPWGTPPSDVLRGADVDQALPVDVGFGTLVRLNSSDSYERLRSNGAWFVLNGNKVFTLC